MNNLLRLEYIPLDDAVLWDRNPKQHDIGALMESIWRYGFQDPPKYDAALGAIVYGNGRLLALQAGWREGRQPPAGIVLTPDDRWAVPVVFGNDMASKATAEAFAVDHNNLTMAGGNFTALDMARMWDVDGYLNLLTEFAMRGEGTVTVDGDDLDALLAQAMADADPDPAEPQQKTLECPKCGHVWQE